MSNSVTAYKLEPRICNEWEPLKALCETLYILYALSHIVSGLCTIHKKTWMVCLSLVLLAVMYFMLAFNISLSLYGALFVIGSRLPVQIIGNIDNAWLTNHVYCDFIVVRVPVWMYAMG